MENPSRHCDGLSHYRVFLDRLWGGSVRPERWLRIFRKGGSLAPDWWLKVRRNNQTFVLDGNQTYTPDQMFKEGLQNMEDGLCYSLNPERGTVNGWNISYNAQDSWWWREVDCETGDKVDRNRVGVCPGFPLDHVPSNPERACLAYNGLCYRCNLARGSECASSWLWTGGSFGSHNIGYYYEQVDCYDPFEEDVDLKCYEIDLNDDENDGFFLLKQQSKESGSFEEHSTINGEVNMIKALFPQMVVDKFEMT